MNQEEHSSQYICHDSFRDTPNSKSESPNMRRHNPSLPLREGKGSSTQWASHRSPPSWAHLAWLVQSPWAGRYQSCLWITVSLWQSLLACSLLFRFIPDLAGRGQSGPSASILGRRVPQGQRNRRRASSTRVGFPQQPQVKSITSIFVWYVCETGFVTRADKNKITEQLIIHTDCYI